MIRRLAVLLLGLAAPPAAAEGYNVGFRYALTASVSEGKLFVMTSANTWPQPQLPQQMQYHQYPVLGCVSTTDGKLLWKKAIDQGLQPHCPVSKPLLTPSQVMVTVREQQTIANRLSAFRIGVVCVK